MPSRLWFFRKSIQLEERRLVFFRQRSTQFATVRMGLVACQKRVRHDNGCGSRCVCFSHLILHLFRPRGRQWRLSYTVLPQGQAMRESDRFLTQTEAEECLVIFLQAKKSLK